MIVIKALLIGYIVSIIGVIILSWFPQKPGTPLYSIFVLMRRVTEPVLEPLRRVIPPVGGVVDLSPTIVLFVLLTVLQLL